MDLLSRRAFLAATGATVGTLATSNIFAAESLTRFKISVISDEISQDFDHACYVISKDFGLHYVELREIWGKNLQVVSDAEIAEAQKILAKYQLQVTDIASPLFKVDWPGAPKSSYSPERDLHGAADAKFSQQDEVLARSISLARQFKTSKIRCFDFWRLDDVTPHRAAINEKLRAAATTAGKQGLMLVIENEFACNTATGRESAQTLAAIQSPSFGLNWDPGNAVMRGELDAYPAGWNALPKNRIHHCHCKNAVKNGAGKIEWSPVDKGFVDWSSQFAALDHAAYRYAISLETHWRGAGTPEESTRVSWAGMQKCLKEANSAQTKSLS